MFAAALLVGGGGSAVAGIPTREGSPAFGSSWVALEGIPKGERNRQVAIFELISTEADYVRNAQFIVEVRSCVHVLGFVLFRDAQLMLNVLLLGILISKLELFLCKLIATYSVISQFQVDLVASKNPLVSVGSTSGNLLARHFLVTDARLII